MEYAHRMWGRVVGVAVLVPAAGFWLTGRLSRPLKVRAGLYSGLVVAQGLLGWWMVKSGLKVGTESKDVPRVSQYRLAAHLGLALVLYSSMLYTALGILAPPPAMTAGKAVMRLKHASHAATGLVFFTALSGQVTQLAIERESDSSHLEHVIKMDGHQGSCAHFLKCSCCLACICWSVATSATHWYRCETPRYRYRCLHVSTCAN